MFQGGNLFVKKSETAFDSILVQNMALFPYKSYLTLEKNNRFNNNLDNNNNRQ